MSKSRFPDQPNPPHKSALSALSCSNVSKDVKRKLYFAEKDIEVVLPFTKEQETAFLLYEDLQRMVVKWIEEKPVLHQFLRRTIDLRSKRGDLLYMKGAICRNSKTYDAGEINTNREGTVSAEELANEAGSDVDEEQNPLTIPEIIRGLRDHERETKRLKLDYEKMEKKHYALLNVLNDKQ